MQIVKIAETFLNAKSRLQSYTNLEANDLETFAQALVKAAKAEENQQKNKRNSQQLTIPLAESESNVTPMTNEESNVTPMLVQTSFKAPPRPEKKPKTSLIPDRPELRGSSWPWTNIGGRGTSKIIKVLPSFKGSFNTKEMVQRLRDNGDKDANMNSVAGILAHLGNLKIVERDSSTSPWRINEGRLAVALQDLRAAGR